MAAAAITLSEFRTRFPEFRQVEDIKVETAIEDATLEMSLDTWGTLYSVGMGYLVAHKLALRYEDPQEPNIGNYRKEFARMQRRVTSGFRVA